ncbi:MAG: hypothetical protein IT210_14335 [Armatimonadetes bacterium]|nr:hypothetical protein [Armatimonadota bacterium]
MTAGAETRVIFLGTSAAVPDDGRDSACLLINEASYGPDPAPSDSPSLYSGAPEAVRAAPEAGAGRLALIHCPENRQSAALAARAIFPETFWPEEGDTAVVAAPR